MQLSPMNTTDVTLKTQNEIGVCGTKQICHGMSNMKRYFNLEMYTSKYLLVIVSTEIKKIKLLNRTQKTWAQKDSKAVGIGVMQGGKYTLGLHGI